MIGEIHLKYEDESYYEILKEKPYFQKFSKLTGNGNPMPIGNCLEAFFLVIQRNKKRKRNYSVRVYQRNDRLDIYFHRFTSENPVNVSDLIRSKPMSFEDTLKIYDFIFNDVKDESVAVFKKAYDFLEKVAENHKASEIKRKKNLLKKRKVSLKEGERVSENTVKEIIKEKKRKELIKAKIKKEKELEEQNKIVKKKKIKEESNKNKLVALAKKRKGK